MASINHLLVFLLYLMYTDTVRPAPGLSARLSKSFTRAAWFSASLKERKAIRPMILAIDIGNSHIVIGCIDNDNVLFTERISTNRGKTELEYAIDIRLVLYLRNIAVDSIDGSIISSVVPPISNIMKKAVEKVIGKEPLLIGPDVDNGLTIRIDNPAQLGSDLIVAAVAGIHEYPVPQVIIDMGTATTLSAIDKNGDFLGGVIIPGMMVALNSLSGSTSQLPSISLEAPEHAIGTNTIDSMKSGTVLANACMLDGMVERIREELGDAEATVIATGGLARYVIPHCRTKIIYDDDLMLKGLNLIYKKNQ